MKNPVVNENDASRPEVLYPDTVRKKSTTAILMSFYKKSLIDISVAIFIFTFAGFFGKLAWYLDITSHFKYYYLVIGLVCGILSFFTLLWKTFAVNLIVILTNAVQIIPIYMPSSFENLTRMDDVTKIKIVEMNVHHHNNDFSRAIQYINDSDPDFLLIEELTPEWLEKLEDATGGFPYRIAEPRNDAFGIAFFSKKELDDCQIMYFGKSEVPSVIATVTVGNKKLSIVSVHTLPPMSSKGFELRNALLESIVSSRNEFGENMVLIGDLNTTPWSWFFKDFVKKTGLADTIRGFGYQASFNARSSFIKIPIDHCLVSNGIIVLRRSIGPDIGSDHYPVFIELGVRDN